jgi:hypothetical protein
MRIAKREYGCPGNEATFSFVSLQLDEEIEQD